jgi:hypothetical protein
MTGSALIVADTASVGYARIMTAGSRVTFATGMVVVDTTNALMLAFPE